MKRFLETAAALGIIMASVAITIGVGVYLMNLPPVAHKSDITKVAAAVSSVSIEANDAKTQATQAALAVKRGPKLKSAEDRLTQDEKEIALLKKRVGLLDGSLLVIPAAPPVKHATKH